MTTRLRCFAGAIAAGGAVLVVAAQASAETATLQLKRLEATGRPGVVYSRSSLDRVYRMTYPQHFYMRIREEGEKVTGSAEAAFSRVIKTEPEKYQLKHPFRGVARLGGQEYGFVLDAKDAESSGYSRLYFDFHHNGDLTDDKPVDAVEAKGRYPVSSSYRYHSFPRVDVTLALDGQKLDYSFFLTVYSRMTGKSGYASASLNAAAYREGEITLDGKTRRVVLLDYNSNGCFNDQCKALKVAKGQTVAMPFGPSYKPVVTASSRGTTETVYLGLSLVGSAGEQCTDMRVKGGRPPKPEFVISTPDGKEVQRGSFAYG